MSSHVIFAFYVNLRELNWDFINSIQYPESLSTQATTRVDRIFNSYRRSKIKDNQRLATFSKNVFATIAKGVCLTFVFFVRFQVTSSGKEVGGKKWKNEKSTLTYQVS